MILTGGWPSLFDANAFVCARSASPDDSGPRTGSPARQNDSVVENQQEHDGYRLAEINGEPVSALLTRLRAGDHTALASLHDACHDRLWRLAMILVRSPEMADDIVHTVFLSLWMRHEALEDIGDLRAYLNAAVRHAVYKAHRHGRVRDAVTTAVTMAVTRGSSDIPALGQQSPNPDVMIESSEFYAAYQRALTALTDRERIALQLRLEDDLSLSEIGQMLGVSKVGAYKIVLRAQEKARALLRGFRP